MHVRTPSVGTLGGLQTAPVVVKGPRREWRKPKPMMNGLKKSDEAIRPVRAANKGARASAESSEERASTKGNPDCQSTRRTQCRASVPQAAARTRKAAERNPKERLTALFHHITRDALGAAYFALKKDAAAGVDGVTWNMYGEGLDERLLGAIVKSCVWADHAAARSWRSPSTNLTPRMISARWFDPSSFLHFL